jgi:imidazole glycerol-phosphate synthase subunit HisF
VALKRIIPLLLYDGTGLVKTVKFRNPSYVGDPMNAIKIFNEKEVDEIIVLDINATRENRRPNFDKIAEMAAEAFMPFAYGGGVKTYDDFALLFKSGVEKVVVNTLIQENPGEVRKAIADFGAQAIVACLDYKSNMLSQKRPSFHAGKGVKQSIVDYAKYLEQELGVGEIMLQSVDRDGTWSGFDEEVTRKVCTSVKIPVIAAGGCGNIADLKSVLYNCSAQAAAVGSMAVYSKKGMGVLISFPDRGKVISGEEVVLN